MDGGLREVLRCLKQANDVFFGGNKPIFAGGGVRRNSNDYSNKTQMAMSKMPPSQPAGTPGPGVRSHYSDRSPVSQGGSVAAAMMRIAKLPRKVEQAPLYEIESAWNEEKRVP